MILFNSLCFAQTGVDFQGLDSGCFSLSFFGVNFCLILMMNKSSKALCSYPLSSGFFYLRFRPDSYNSLHFSSQGSTFSTSVIYALCVCTGITGYNNFNADVAQKK